MRNQYLSIFTLVLLISTLACSQSQDQFSPNSELNTLIDSASYVLAFKQETNFTTVDLMKLALKNTWLVFLQP